MIEGKSVEKMQKNLVCCVKCEKSQKKIPKFSVIFFKFSYLKFTDNNRVNPPEVLPSADIS
jgi:hypothetical protein